MTLSTFRTIPFTIVVPTFNERENLTVLASQLLYIFKENRLDGSVVIVDDGSPDGTGELADEISREHPNFKVFHRPRKAGIGSAYREGFRMAIEEGCELVFEMDSDLSHDPSFIPDFLRAIDEGWDVIIGSRYVPGSKVIGWSWHRSLVSKVANFLSRHLAGLKVCDATSGYRAIRAGSLCKVDLDGILSDGYAFQIELLFELDRITKKIREIPTTFVNRRKGKSKLSIMDIVQFARTIVGLSARRILSQSVSK